MSSRTNKRSEKYSEAAMLCNLTGGLLLCVVILLCALLTAPRFAGCQIYHVVSGSMEPAIPTGSLVYVKEAEAADIQENEVIAYYSDTDSGAIITHRVVKNQVVSGRFITKGDANEQEDPMPVPYDRLMGKVVFSLPKLGRILAIMTEPSGKIAAACLVLAAVLLRVTAERLERNNREKNLKKI